MSCGAPSHRSAGGVTLGEMCENGSVLESDYMLLHPNSSVALMLDALMNVEGD